jgi:hypothetical protein
MKVFQTAAVALLAATAAFAHVGSPDVYLDGQAGPYKLFITIRPPNVIPGVAEIDVRSETSGIQQLRAVPLPMSGPGAKYAPIPDDLKRSTNDPQFFSGALWLMAPGSWQVRLTADGASGTGKVSVPIPAVALKTKTMDRGLGTILFVLMLLLVIGLIAMVRAAAREAELPAGKQPDVRQNRRGWRSAIITACVVVGVLWYGAGWWNSQALAYGETVFKPLNMRATVQGTSLLLHLTDPGWIGSDLGNFAALPASRSVDDLVPDHQHLMHLYMIRQPGMDVVLHLHPEQMHAGEFKLDLPNMPAGDYKLYADIVHENGLPETPVASINVPPIKSHAVTGDDAFGTAAAYSQASLDTTQFPLPDGYRMQWIRDTTPMRARQPQAFRFRLVDAHGNAPADMALYMGMLGHAAFVKPDGTVFAHIHPTGSVSMSAFMQANGMAGMDAAMHAPTGALPDEVTFPYGFPSPGRYRIIVQMKHGSTIETGIFDTQAN